jgi:uncharacterized small protein (DUF1192 family)
MVLLFDQTKSLEKAFGEEPAAALIKVLEAQDAATRKDLVTSGQFETRLAEVRLEIERLRAEMSEKIAETKTSLIKWMTGVALTQVVVIAALVKLL